MKDAKGHGSEKRGGGDYAPSASGKPGYNPRVQGGGRMFGRQPTAAEKAANSANVKAFSNFAAGQNATPPGVGPRQAAMARLEASGKIPAGTLSTVAGLLGAGAHTQGVQAVGQRPAAPNFRLNSYTHEIVSPTGEVTARMRLGKNNGLAVDYPAGPRGGTGNGSHAPQIARSGGPSIHDAVAMPDYMASQKGSNSFPAEHISGALHFLTGNDFAGHTVRRVKG